MKSYDLMMTTKLVPFCAIKAHTRTKGTSITYTNFCGNILVQMNMLDILLQIYEHATFFYTATNQPMMRKLYKINSLTEHKSQINMSSDGDPRPFPRNITVTHP